MFAKYIDTIKRAKMLEVCSTTMPQKSIPIIMSDPRYAQHLKDRSKEFEIKSQIAYDIFKDTP
jgi:alanine-synthesizing transaminase